MGESCSNLSNSNDHNSRSRHLHEQSVTFLDCPRWVDHKYILSRQLFFFELLLRISAWLISPHSVFTNLFFFSFSFFLLFLCWIWYPLFCANTNFMTWMNSLYVSYIFVTNNVCCVARKNKNCIRKANKTSINSKGKIEWLCQTINLIHFRFLEYKHCDTNSDIGLLADKFKK